MLIVKLKKGHEQIKNSQTFSLAHKQQLSQTHHKQLVFIFGSSNNIWSENLDVFLIELKSNLVKHGHPKNINDATLSKTNFPTCNINSEVKNIMFLHIFNPNNIFPKNKTNNRNIEVTVKQNFNALHSQEYLRTKNHSLQHNRNCL